MYTFKKTPSGRCHAAHGFALVTALALMGFLVLLLVSLVALVKVESRRATTELDHFRARQNALLGLRLAQAQLQRQLGPDRSVSARADILDGSIRSDGEGDETLEVAEGKRYWTGVWSVTDLQADGADDPDRVASAEWLVSGHRSGDDFSRPFASTERTAELWSFNGDTVQVPLIAISEEESVGNDEFGYWVADEGVKALASLQNPWLHAAPDSAGSRNRLRVATRYGIENIDGLNDLDEYFNPESDEQMTGLLSRVLNRGQVAWLGEGITSTVIEKERFHDVTAVSLGVLSNTRDGGLRTDLTRGFDSETFDGETLLFPDGPRWRLLWLFQQLARSLGDGIDVVPPQTSGMRVQTLEWRDEAIQIAPVLVSSGLSFGLQLEDYGGPTSDEEGRFIEKWNAFREETIEHYNLNEEDAPTYAEYAADYFGEYLRLIPWFQPWLILANPYDIALAEADYEVKYRTGNRGADDGTRSPGDLNPRVILKRPGYEGNREQEDAFDLIRVNEMVPHEELGDDREWEYAGMSYRLRLSTAFEPGEVKAFFPVEQSGQANSHRIELEEVDIESFNPLATNRWLRGRLQTHVDIGYGYENRARDGDSWDPQLTKWADEVEWRRFLDRRRALVHRALSNEVFSVSDAISYPPQYRIGIAMLPSDYAGDPDDIELTENQLYQMAVGKPRNVSDTETSSLGAGGMEQLMHTKISIKASHRRIQQLRMLIHTNFRSPSGEYFQPKNPDDDELMRPGWGLVAPYIALEADGGTNALYEFNSLWEDAEDSDNRVILFHLPRRQLFSLGDYQHLDISASSYSALYAMGNSFASPWIPPDDYRVLARESGTGHVSDYFHDVSWQLNAVLWDSYYFSTWPQPGEQSDSGPANPRLIPTVSLDEAALADENTISGQLMIAGPFNINSTSIEAWKAVLSNHNQLPLYYRDAASGDVEQLDSMTNPLMRSPLPAGDSDDYWRGFRELSAGQVDRLARAIVDEVRRKGPFPSLAAFINRDLADADDPDALMGPLQRAIEESAINEFDWRTDEVDFDDGGTFLFDEAVPGKRSDGAPGFLTQADILRPLGPIISSRSDTFVIRAYGEAGGEAGDGTTARARCEAVVQRLPAWIDAPTVPPEADPTAIGERFGRRFQLISLRWLASDE